MTAGFDQLAPAYQRLWTDTPAGQLQREAVWQHASEFCPAGSHLLDLGCGTGDDALILAARGVRVTGIDASSEMVRIARGRGVDAEVRAIEGIGEINGAFDGVLSNFGALNCVERLADLREPLARLIKPGGSLIVCLMSRICLWETLVYAAHGELKRAVRRWSGEAGSSVVSRVYYPAVRTICHSFAPDFKLVAAHGIGVAVPPSYVTRLSGNSFTRLAALDRRIASLPVLRSLGDHRLLIFRKGLHR